MAQTVSCSSHQRAHLSEPRSPCLSQNTSKLGGRMLRTGWRPLHTCGGGGLRLAFPPGDPGDPCAVPSSSLSHSPPFLKEENKGGGFCSPRGSVFLILLTGRLLASDTSPDPAASDSQSLWRCYWCLQARALGLEHLALKTCFTASSLYDPRKENSLL